MKKIFYLLLVIIFVSSLKISSVEAACNFAYENYGCHEDGSSPLCSAPNYCSSIEGGPCSCIRPPQPTQPTCAGDCRACGGNYGSCYLVAGSSCVANCRNYGGWGYCPGGCAPTQPPPQPPAPTSTPIPTVTTTPTSTQIPTPTPNPSGSQTPTPTPNSNCTCQGVECSSSCIFDKYSLADGVNYINPLKCYLTTNVLATVATDANKTSWCQATKRTKGDADGSGIINMTDYLYYVAAVNGGKIPATVNPDFNGDGEVGSSDRAIIIKTLNP